MTLRRLFTPTRLVATAILGATAIACIWMSNTPRFIANDIHLASFTTAADEPAHVVSPELIRILAEPDNVRRQHLLATWVHGTRLEHISRDLRGLPEDRRQEVRDMALLKLREENPHLSDTHRLIQYYPELFAADLSPRPPASLRDTFLAEAKTDPERSFRRAISTPMDADEREEVLTQILELVSRDNPRRALALLATTRGVNQIAAINRIARDWARIDPPTALAWAMEHGRNPHPLFVVLEEWSLRDPAAALEAATMLPPSEHTSTYMKSLLVTWIKASPAESAGWISALSDPDPTLISAAVEALAKTHPSIVQPLLDKPMSAPLRNDLTRTLARAWSATDPAAAARWVHTLPKDRIYPDIVATVVDSLAGSDIPAAMALYRSIPEGVDSLVAMTALFSRMPRQQGIEWLLNEPSPMAMFVLNEPEFSTPDRLAAALATIPPGPRLERGYEIASRRVIEKNTADALAWMRALPNDKIRALALEEVGYDWARRAPEDAAAYARELGPDSPGQSFSALIPGISIALMHRDPAAAVDWLLSLPPNPIAREKIATTFASLTKANSAEALRRIQSLPVGETRNAALTGFFSHQASNAPDSAAQSLLSVATPSEQLTLVATVVASWAGNAPADAEAWIRTLAPGPLRDAALTQGAEALTRNDPASLPARVSLASTDNARYEIARASLLAIQYTDDAAARAALAQLPLSPAIKDRLKEQLDIHAGL